MTDLIDVVARLRAFEQGRAVRLTSHQHVAIRPDALILAPLAMAGEDTTIHAIAVGRIGEMPQVRSVPDPRRRDDQYALFEWITQTIDPYIQQCLDAATYPQFWVSSHAAVALLDTLADRLRYNTQNALVKRLGEVLSYATGRVPIAGQQTLLSATSVLARHWATGQEASEDEHLGAILTWIHPPATMPIQAAIAYVERVPAGIKTDPRFDQQTLAPLVDAYNKAWQRHASQRELQRRAALIEGALCPVATRIYRGIQRAIDTLHQAYRPPLPDLAAMEQREIEEFTQFMVSRAAGYGIALHDAPKPAAFKLAEREEALQTVHAALRRGDRVARARARLNGKSVVGVVITTQRIRLAARRFQGTFTLESTQQGLHLRVGDELVWVDDPRLQVEVADLRRRGSTREILMIMKKGLRAIGLPATGTPLEFVPALPNWERLGRERGHLKERLDQTPWTHQATPRPVLPPLTTSPTTDPLAAVEALR